MPYKMASNGKLSPQCYEISTKPTIPGKDSTANVRKYFLHSWERCKFFTSDILPFLFPDPIPCRSEPCQNNATCNNTDGGFNCTCALGYYGDLCSERDHCIPNPCLNNATCNRNSTDFKCSCSDGYYGDVCDLRDWCYPEPCMHNGVCSFNETAYHCACERTYIGRQCETGRITGFSPVDNMMNLILGNLIFLATFELFNS